MGRTIISLHVPVHTPVVPGHERAVRVVRVPRWLGNKLVVCLYGLAQSSPIELTFEVELGIGVISLHSE